MNKTRPRLAFLGALAAALLLWAWRIYQGRSRERVVSHEGLDDPAVARAFNLVATMPQMRLMRAYAIRRALSMVQTGRAADLGCGPGHLAIELARAAPNLQVTGIDLSDEMLAKAGERAVSAGLADRIDFRTGDVARIPFPDDALDLVISTLSLHHWSDPVAVLDEIARVVRPGGAFLVFDLRRDMAAPLYLLLWFATHFVVPGALRRVNEPLGSRDAAFTLQEAVHLAGQSSLTGWRVTHGPLWLTIEGTQTWSTRQRRPDLSS